MIGKKRLNKSLFYYLCAILLIASPIVLLLVVITWSGGTIGSSHPIWSDELAYWHEVLSFSQKGFNYGYYSIDELHPQYMSFGTHGCGAISVYSLYAVIFGWNTNSIVVANCLFISLAFAFLVLVIKPSIKQMVGLSVFYLTFTPVILYCATSMTELLNYSLLVVYMVLLHLYMQPKSKKGWLFAILLAVCTTASLVRIIYIVLFLPVFFERNGVSKFNFKFVKTVILWLCISVVLYLFVAKLTTPYPFSFLSQLFGGSSLLEMISLLAVHSWKNTVRMFSLFNGNLILVSLRYFMVAITIYCLIKSKLIQSKFSKWESLYLYLFWILFSFILINVMTYDIFDWRDYRVFAPVLFSVIILLFMANNSVMKIAIPVNILSLFLLIGINIGGFFDKTRYEILEDNLELKSIEYNNQAQTPFENTLILESFSVESTLSAPAGIGVSVVVEKDISDDLLSQYIYVDREYNLNTYEIVKSSSKGILYKKKNRSTVN